MRLIAALLALTALVAPSGTAGAADAAKGEVLAKRWCATCHVVAADQKVGSTQAPPFSAIARKPGFDAAQVALFLLDPHPKMPDMGLSRSEAADLAAYIAAQK
ncbi:MAG: c-type cytochrome [Proteobacteria bacterium]|nr:c-type cytochrome [Pseudomonadota bacterium]